MKIIWILSFIILSGLVNALVLNSTPWDDYVTGQQGNWDSIHGSQFYWYGVNGSLTWRPLTFGNRGNGEWNGTVAGSQVVLLNRTDIPEMLNITSKTNVVFGTLNWTARGSGLVNISFNWTGPHLSILHYNVTYPNGYNLKGDLFNGFNSLVQINNLNITVGDNIFIESNPGNLNYSLIQFLNFTSNNFSPNGIYLINNTVDSPTRNYTEGQVANITSNIYSYNAMNLNVNFSVSDANGTTYNLTKTIPVSIGPNVISFYPIIGNNGNLAGNYVYENFSFTGIDANGTSNFFSGKINTTVYTMMLTSCSSPSVAQMINFSILNETNFVGIANTSIILTSTIHPTNNIAFNKSFSFSFNTSLGISNATCIFPQWANYSIENQFTISKAGFVTRYYYLAGNFSNNTMNESFFMFPLGLASEVDITLKDYAGNFLTGYEIEARKFNASNGTYYSVESVTADFAGHAIMFLDNSTQYQFNIYTSKGVFVQSFVPVVFSASQLITTNTYSITFTVGIGTPPIYRQTAGQISSSCQFSNTTSTISCDVIDETNTAINITLIVQNITASGWNTICSAYSQGSSGTVSCTLASYNNSFLRYQVTLWNSDGSYFVADNGILDYRTGLIQWGNLGFIVTFFIVLAAFAIGSWNPVAAMFMAGFGIIIAFIFQAVSFPFLIGTLCLILLLSWKSRA